MRGHFGRAAGDPPKMIDARTNRGVSLLVNEVGVSPKGRTQATFVVSLYRLLELGIQKERPEGLKI